MRLRHDPTVRHVTDAKDFGRVAVLGLGLIGGSLTVLCALVWPRLFPKMAGIDRLESLHPAAET